MSILIKGINAHRGRCWECPCFNEEYGECNVLEEDTHYIDKDKECPLIEIPEHGDLIDRDALKVPSAQLTIYGYNIEHLELIARVLQKEKLPPERIVEVLTDIGRIIAIVKDEFEEGLRKAVEQCMI